MYIKVFLSVIERESKLYKLDKYMYMYISTHVAQEPACTCTHCRYSSMQLTISSSARGFHSCYNLQLCAYGWNSIKCLVKDLLQIHDIPDSVAMVIIRLTVAIRLSVHDLATFLAIFTTSSLSLAIIRAV